MNFTQAVLDAARHSMGMDISEIDLLNVHTFAERVIQLAEYRLSLQVIASVIASVIAYDYYHHRTDTSHPPPEARPRFPLPHSLSPQDLSLSPHPLPSTLTATPAPFPLTHPFPHRSISSRRWSSSRLICKP